MRLKLLTFSLLSVLLISFLSQFLYAGDTISTPQSITLTSSKHETPLYAAIKEGLENCNITIDLSKTGIDVSDFDLVNNTWNTVMDEHPELLCSGDSYSYAYKGNEAILTEKYFYPKDILLAMRAALEKKMQEILKTIPAKADEYTKELAIHDYLVKNSKYDENFFQNNVSKDSYTAYGLLLKGKAVCSGYAEAFKLLCNRAGIECIIVEGRALSGNALGNHAWNIVKINGRYYQVDVTFDDPVPDRFDRVNRIYFNVTDNEISKNHTWDKTKTPKCSSSVDNYFVKNKLVVNSSAEWTKLLKTALDAKAASITAKITNYDPNIYDVKKTINSITAKNKMRISYTRSEDKAMGMVYIFNIKYY